MIPPMGRQRVFTGLSHEKRGSDVPSHLCFVCLSSQMAVVLLNAFFF